MSELPDSLPPVRKTARRSWAAQAFANINLTVGAWPTADFSIDALVGAVIASIAGIIVGTYSSIFIASPVLIIWEEWRGKRQPA